MTEKILDTRIQLKYDSYENWSNNQLGEGKGANLILKKGEVGFCEIPSGNANATTAPTVLFKVGDGTTPFSGLKWASALAADVYEWAKQSTLFIQKEGTGNVVSGITWDATLNNGKGGVKFTTAAVATAQGLEDLQKEVYGENGSASDSRIDKLEQAINTNKTAWEKYEDTRYSFSTDGDKLVVKKTLYTNGVAGTEEAVGTYEFLTTDEVNTILENYYNKTQVDNLIKEAKDYADQHDANTEYHVEYDSTNKKIKLVAGADATKMEIDATAFIKDGMISTVTVDDNHDLVISFNTDAGTEDIVIPLDEFIDIYTGKTGERVNIAVSNKNEISADLVVGSIAKSYLDANVQASLDKANSAIQDHQDISGKADKVQGATANNFAGLDANGNLIDSGKKASDFATKEQGVLADNAVQGVTNVTNNGLILTKNTENIVSVDWDPDIVFVFNCGTSTTVI